MRILDTIINTPSWRKSHLKDQMFEIVPLMLQIYRFNATNYRFNATNLLDSDSTGSRGVVTSLKKRIVSKKLGVGLM